MLIDSPISANQPVAVCRLATKADIANIEFVVQGEEALEQPKTRVATKYQEYRGSDYYSVVMRWRHSSRTCIRLRWRAAPFGQHAASSADFPGLHWPSGVVTMQPSDRLNFYTAGRPEPEINFPARDDQMTEVTETFRIEVLDESGNVIWGGISPKPERSYSDLLWRNPDGSELKGGVIMTIHDTPRVCPDPVDMSSWLTYATYYGRRSGLIVERPRDRANIQCASISWRIRNAGPNTLKATDFIGNRYPSGVLTFSSWATGDPEEDNAQTVPLRLKWRPVKGRRTLIDFGRGRTKVSRVITFPSRESINGEP